MSILIPKKSKSKLFNEEILIYLLCMVSYIILLSVVSQYCETKNTFFFKPDRILIYLLYSGELLFIFLFSPIFVLTQFTAIDEKNGKKKAINIYSKASFSKQVFFEIILKAFILLTIFHIISFFSIYSNIYFSLPSFFMIVPVLFVFSLFIIAYTSFLIVMSRNISFSIATVYITIIGIFGCIFFISPLLDMVSDPTPVINLTLIINPMMAIASLLNLNIFRLDPFYEITNIEMFEYNYPHWNIHVASYLMLSILFFTGTLLLSRYHNEKQESVLNF